MSPCRPCKGRGWIWTVGGLPDEILPDICTSCEGTGRR